MGAAFALMGAAFLVAGICRPRRGAKVAVILALMVTCPVWAVYSGLGQPHPQALQDAVSYAHSKGAK